MEVSPEHPKISKRLETFETRLMVHHSTVYNAIRALSALNPIDCSRAIEVHESIIAVLRSIVSNQGNDEAFYEVLKPMS